MNSSALKRKSVGINYIALLCVCTLALAACAPQAAMREMPASEGLAPAAPQEMADFESAAKTNSFAAGSTQVETERLVIKNANLSVVVDDAAKSMDRLSAMAEEMGGFVVSAQLYQYELDGGVEIPRASITIRVPAEKLDEALTRIESESDRPPTSKNIESQDVTKEYTDQKSRLRNLEAAETQLQKIMDEAFNTEDVLSVYNQLVQVREQIEITKGQIQYYEQSAALSSVTVELIPNEAEQPLTIGGWQPVGIARDAVQALINTVQFLANALIWIIIFFVPVLFIFYLIFVLPLSLVWRYWRRRRPNRKSEAKSITPPPPPEA